MNNTNYIDGVQYPYGFKDWLRTCAFILREKYGCFVDKPLYQLWECLDEKAWFGLFKEGLSPQKAVKANMKGD